MSRIAWFRAAPPDAADPLDETAPILDSLRRRHHIDIVTAAEAHSFVWRHFREPYDACVYELGSTPAHAFMRAYYRHYPGPVARRGMGVNALASGSHRSVTWDSPQTVGSGSSRKTLTLGLPDRSRLDVVERAAARATQAGAAIAILPASTPDIQIRDADVVVALEWPPAPGAPTAALLGMAAARPVIVLETEGTAVWPALDPQTWRPRGYVEAEPIVVSIDPRDEEHSLMLALVRLAADRALGLALGTAAYAWWRTHATLDHAVAAWERLLEEARGQAARRTRNAPDGSESARAILAKMGVTVDFLPMDSPVPS